MDSLLLAMGCIAFAVFVGLDGVGFVTGSVQHVISSDATIYISLVF